MPGSGQGFKVYTRITDAGFFVKLIFLCEGHKGRLKKFEKKAEKQLLFTILIDIDITQFISHPDLSG
jgi:hypothetical protein